MRKRLLPEELKTSPKGICGMNSVSDNFEDGYFRIFSSYNSKKVKVKVAVE